MTNELTQLEAKMGKLCAQRDTRVRLAEAEIRQANRDFDRLALPLGRKINALREKLESPPPPPPKKIREPDPDWTPEDQAHYLELSKR